MLLLQNVAFKHQHQSLLFQQVQLSIEQDKIALIGKNGTGKSTLLQLMAGLLPPTEGQITASTPPYYVPQHFGQFDELTIAEALSVSGKLHALQAILNGEVTEGHMTILDDDWDIEARCQQALRYWGLPVFDWNRKLSSLSGGQKTKVLLGGIILHRPGIILLDEPSNHLDSQSRQCLYEFIKTFKGAVVLVSHDRNLLNLLDTTCELDKHGLHTYGGNYSFYQIQQQIAADALKQDIKETAKAVRKAKEVARQTAERKQKLDARGKKKQEKAGMPVIVMNSLRNNAQNSTARLEAMHSEKLAGLQEASSELRAALPDMDKIKLHFESAALHNGKIMLKGENIQFGYGCEPLWENALNFEVTSGDRLSITGRNGSGKTTLVKLMLGALSTSAGRLYRAEAKKVYIDQDYALIDDNLTVFEQAEKYKATGLQEHEINSWLTRFLFTASFWDKRCSTLSGGEKMRLMLCCLAITAQAPDMIFLDEPTNNLDIQNLEILTAVMQKYQGTLVVIAHDNTFTDSLGLTSSIDLNKIGNARSNLE